MNIITAVQARTSSSRLPCKVLLPLCGEPLLTRLTDRIKKAKLYGELVVATSISRQDDPIENLCINKNINCFRGDLYDLLDRHYQLALEYQADALVKIPSDCPLIDPQIIDQAIGYYLNWFRNLILSATCTLLHSQTVMMWRSCLLLLLNQHGRMQTEDWKGSTQLLLFGKIRKSSESEM